MNATQAATDQPIYVSTGNGHSKARVGYPIPSLLLWITIVKIWAVVGLGVYVYGEFLRQQSNILLHFLYPDIVTTTNIIPLAFYMLLIILSIWWTVTADPRGWGMMLFFCVSEIVTSLIGIAMFSNFYQFLESIGHAWTEYPMTDLMMALFIPIIIVDLIFMGYYFSGGVMRYFGVQNQSRLKAFVVLIVVSIVISACIYFLSETIFGLEMARLGYEGLEFDIQTLMQ